MNFIKVIKSVKNNVNIQIEPIIDLYIDRIIKSKNMNTETSIKNSIIQEQATKIASLTGLKTEEILKPTNIEGKILDLVVPSNELNFKVKLEESFEQGIEMLELKAHNSYHGDENR